MNAPLRALEDLTASMSSQDAFDCHQKYVSDAEQAVSCTLEMLKGGLPGLSRVLSGGGASKLMPRSSLDRGYRACTSLLLTSQYGKARLATSRPTDHCVAKWSADFADHCSVS